MPMPALLQQNQTGTTAPWFADWMQAPFSLSIGAVSTGCIFNVEYTLDNIEVANIGPFSGNANATTIANATWFQSSVTATTGNASGNISSPVRAVRVNITSTNATGFVVVNLMQATYPGS